MNSKTNNKTNIVDTSNINILALIGANELLLAALKTPRGVFFRAHSKGLQHNEHIVRLAQEVLEMGQCSQQDLDAIAVDLGPSSFTGQRISLSFAKGISFALGKPLVGITTFALWQRYYRETSCSCPVLKEPLLIVIDGRKRRFYASLYRGDEAITWDLGTEKLCSALSTHLATERTLAVSGPGAPLFLEELAELNGPAAMKKQETETPSWWKGLHFHPPASEADLARCMLLLAEEQIQAQNFMKASDGPIYLRKSDAQEQREEKEARGEGEG